MDSLCIAQGAPGIVYGTSVSRNEFGINGGLFWSAGGERLAFYRKDETRVTDFPLLDIKTRTGSLKTVKYPMNGMASEHITLGVWDVATGSVVWIEPTDFDDERYLTCVSWNPSATRGMPSVLPSGPRWRSRGRRDRSRWRWPCLCLSAFRG